METNNNENQEVIENGAEAIEVGQMIGAAVKTVVEGQAEGQVLEDAASTEKTVDSEAEVPADSKEASDQPEQKGFTESSEGSDKIEGSDKQETPAPAAATPKKKWHEEEGANPYVSGDYVEVVGGPDLIGRLAVVVKASNKKDALKARLINNKNGELQGCEVCLDFNRIEKTEKRWQPKVEQSTPAADAEKPVSEAQDKEQAAS